MASVTIMASVTYGKCIMESVIMATVFMANVTEPLTSNFWDPALEVLKL